MTNSLARYPRPEVVDIVFGQVGQRIVGDIEREDIAVELVPVLREGDRLASGDQEIDASATRSDSSLQRCSPLLTFQTHIWRVSISVTPATRRPSGESTGP